MAVGHMDGARSIGALLRDLAEGSATIVRNEVRLAKIEITQMLRALGVGTGLVASGGVLLLVGGLTLLTGVIMLAGDQWLGDAYWLAALIVTAILAALTWWFVSKGRRELSPERLAPDETVATLKEDKEWLKRQLTSGATSR
ncbi:MAG TPA: phage holin family protein [Gemmatimonadaceae bacterium]